MKNGIEIEIVWLDENILQFLFSCSNGCFSGQTEIYSNHDDLPKMVEALRGFPARVNDVREIDLGTYNPVYANGGIQVHLRCTDSVGHAVAEVKLRGDACKGMGEPESVALRIPIQGAAVDSFILQISLMKKEIGANAHLRMEK